MRRLRSSAHPTRRRAALVFGAGCSLPRWGTRSVFLLFLSISHVGATNYIAYSLRSAEAALNSLPHSASSELRTLGGITQLTGVVYDPRARDLILVGEHHPGGAQITLDDFAVALRSRLLLRQWPEVSIDPAPDTAKTGYMKVRIEGGIEGTQFGRDLYEADYLLKRISLGIEPSRVVAVPSNWSLVDETLRTLADANGFDITSRFWFYPVLKAVKVRQNVASVSGLEVKVFTEVLSANVNGRATKDLHDLGSEHFARNVSDHFNELVSVHPAFGRVQVLNELVAVTRAIELLESPVDLDYWLTRYPIGRGTTPKQVKELERRGDVPKASGGVSAMSYQGGVLLQALAIRVNAGDITALRDVVLRTRPKATTLTWGFALAGNWIIPGGGSDAGLDTVGEMYSHAAFLIEQQRFDDAAAVYDSIGEIAPSLRAEARSGKASALFLKGLSGVGSEASDAAIRGALDLLKDAIKTKPDCSECLYRLGYTMTVLGMHRDATEAFTEALRVNPREYLAHFGLGVVFYKIEKDADAVMHFKEYLKYASTGPYAEQAEETLKKLGAAR